MYGSTVVDFHYEALKTGHSPSIRGSDDELSDNDIESVNDENNTTKDSINTNDNLFAQIRNSTICINNNKFLKSAKIIFIVAFILCLLLLGYRIYNDEKLSNNNNNKQNIILNQIKNINSLKTQSNNNNKYYTSYTNENSKSRKSIAYSNDALNDLILKLPGLENAPLFNQVNYFSGFLDIQTTDRKIFYWFVESQNNPLTDPLLVWTNGGPGCSGIVAALTEHGPFLVQSDGTVNENEYSWNKVANVLYIEQPFGVGFSSNAKSGNGFVFGDSDSTSDIDLIIRSFLSRYTMYQTNDLYLASESYGGHYVPLTAKTILERNKNSFYSPKIKLKGVLVGNPYTDPYENEMGMMSSLYGHGLVKSTYFEAWMNYCYGKSYKIINSVKCTKIFIKAVYKVVISNINFYAVDYDDCSSYSLTDNDLSICNNDNIIKNTYNNDDYFISLNSRYKNRKILPSNIEILWYDKLNNVLNNMKHNFNNNWIQILEIEFDFLNKYGKVVNGGDLHTSDNDMPNVHPLIHSKVKDNNNNDKDTQFSYITCSVQYLYCYMNTLEVQQNLNVLSHFSTNDDIIDWTPCSIKVNNAWPDSDLNRTDIPSVYKTLIEDYDIKILIYSGDNDAVCATEGTLYWMNNKMDGYEIDSNNDFVAWSLEDDDTYQVAGYYTKYISSLDSSTAWHFTTVRSAGHMVPSTQPKRALEVLKKFLNDWNN